MEKIFKAFGNSSVMIICGTVLAINSLNTLGIILISLGVIGSVFHYALNIQREKEEKEEREKLYGDITKSLANAVNVPFLNNTSDQVH